MFLQPSVTWAQADDTTDLLEGDDGLIPPEWAEAELEARELEQVEFDVPTLPPPGPDGEPTSPEPDFDTDTALPPPTAPERSPGMILSPEDFEIDTGSSPVRKKTSQKDGMSSLERRIRKEAFDAAINGMLPLKPDEIRKVLEEFDKSQQAASIPIYPYPEPVTAVETVSLDPGAKPPVIKVSAGHVTTLSILDITGEPWPIQDMTWAGDFEIITPEAGENIVRITPLSDFTYGNMSMRLLELDTPVIFILKTHRDEAHYRFDARIPEYGPHAAAPLIEAGIKIHAGGGALGAILDGIPPEEAIRLDVTGADSRTTAYIFQDLTYLRTPLTLLSPGWSASVSSADGMQVYALTNAPVVLLSDRGKVVRARLQERELLNE